MAFPKLLSKLRQPRLLKLVTPGVHVHENTRGVSDEHSLPDMMSRGLEETYQTFGRTAASIFWTED
jgi:hypothetical protein